MKTHLVITGTHQTPAMALINHLKNKSYKLTYIGNPSFKIPINVIPFSSPKFDRHNYFSLLALLFKLPLSIFKAWFLLKKLKPNLVFSFGGYIAMPICFTAKILNIPVIIHEQTMATGLVNKLTSPIAQKIAISWPQSFKHFPKQKTVLTGNPIRKSIINLKPKKPTKTIYIIGGHQGSKIINQTIRKSLPHLLKQYSVIHQFGLLQDEKLWQKQSDFKHPNYTIAKWFNQKEHAKNLLKSQLVIGRSGANTITELGYLGKPSILIPLPFAQKNEQALNARYLKKLGLALILPQSKLTPKSLLKYIKKAGKILPQKSSDKFPKKLVESALNNLEKLINET